MTRPDPPLAAIVLAGGRSRRMGADKAALAWHGGALVHRVCGLLARVADPVVVVRAARQRLPELPPGIETVVDGRPDRGPLEGMAAGFRALAGRRDVAFVCATDLPFLHPAFVCALAARLADCDVAVAAGEGHTHHLTAVYRTSLLPAIEAQLAADRLRVGLLLERARVARVSLAELPHPESVDGLNDSVALAAARGAPEPRVEVSPAGGDPVAVRASSLGRALAGVLDGGPPPARVRLNGRAIPADPRLPLADGDRVVLEAG